MNIERSLQIQGWMSETELTYLAQIAEKCESAIVEIGCYKGRSACTIAGNTRARLYCVDIWSECGTDGWFYDVFQENTKGLDNIVPINHASIWAARKLGAWKLQFDMIFIDAAHDELNLTQDILSWRPLLKEGGIFCGHDYGNSHYPDVKKVVDQLVPKFRVIDSIWTTEGV